MKAVVIYEYGGPEVLCFEDVPDPVPGPGEVVVKVHAVSVNRVLDVGVRQGTQQQRGITLPLIPGIDPSGVVHGAGIGVVSPKIGDRVAVLHRIPCGTCPQCEAGRTSDCERSETVGIHRPGGDAEFVKVPATSTIALPDDLSFAEASAIARHAPTAFGLLEDRARLKAGEWVLVMGAAGGLGSFGVQVAKLLGARVIAGAGSDERVAIGIELGADHGVNYRRFDLAEEVMRITEGRGVDVVYENISDPDIWPQALASLARRGRLVTAGAHGGGTVALDIRRLYHERLRVIGGAGYRRGDLDRAMAAAADGKLRAKIAQTLPLSEVAEAHRIIETSVPAGKIILDPTRG